MTDESTIVVTLTLEEAAWAASALMRERSLPSQEAYGKIRSALNAHYATEEPESEEEPPPEKPKRGRPRKAAPEKPQGKFGTVHPGGDKE